MALLSDDLFLVQRQADNKLFKLQLDALIAEVGGDDNTSVTGVLPILSNNSATAPEISVLEARTSTEATNATDGLGTAGVVNRLAEVTDVGPTGSGDSFAVVTADLLKATNLVISQINQEIIDINDALDNIDGGGTGASTHVGENPPANPSQGDLWYHTEEGILFVYYTDEDSSQWVDTNPSGVGTDEDGIATVNQVLTQNTYNNDALEINPNTGTVNIEIKNASQSASGVVRFADATDLSNSTVGVAVDAAQLMDLAVELNNLSNTVNEISPGIQSISEGGTNIVDSALQISTLSADETALGINEGVFTPFDFSALTNVTD